MNPINLSPVALAFWSGVLRHALAGIATLLVAHGYTTQSGANAYVEELIGVLFYAGAQVWSNRAAELARAKMLLAMWLANRNHLPLTEARLDAHLAQGLPVPALTTPPDSVPGVPTQNEMQAQEADRIQRGVSKP